ncbi:MAG: type VII secretion protein EccB, partial [Actinomycetota bacterium]|nr:type VII secretion protein EccB [Actinomycetota bacterium]
MAELDGPERRRRRGFRLTAKYQVSGWRFLYRRLQHALVRRDTRMIDDPQRAQSGPLMLGLVLAVVIGVGAVVFGLFSPGGLVKDAKIVVDKESGALWVRIGDHLDPVTNLTSARLIVGRPENPVKASSSEINKYPHGSLVGIIGAPVDIRDSANPDSVWTVCDTTMTGSAVPLDPVS